MTEDARPERPPDTALMILRDALVLIAEQAYYGPEPESRRIAVDALKRAGQ